jgi:molecular chaperone GrpE
MKILAVKQTDPAVSMRGRKHMTDKKHKAKTQDKSSELEEFHDEQPEAATPVVSLEEFELLKKQLEDTQASAAEYLDGWQRSQAEFSNYKKRLEREQAGTTQLMRGAIIARFLPVLDDLQRALSNRPTDEASQSWVSGIELIQRKLQAILDAEGVIRIEAEGKMFDPNLHEAISNEPSEDHESGQIIAVVQQGYILGERVIRHAVVRVAQ